MSVLTGIWRDVQRFSAKHELLGPDFAVMEQMKRDGWNFVEKDEAVSAAYYVSVVKTPRPVNAAGEFITRDSPEWGAYEQARRAAVEKVYPRNAPQPPACGCS